MKTSAGKGPELRKGANLQLYWQNYDAIFRKDKLSDLTEEEKEQYEKDKNSMSYSEWKKFLNK